MAFLTTAGCATPYAYAFRLIDPEPHALASPGDFEGFEDADVRARVRVDPIGANAVFLEVTNKTDQVIQVQWDRVTISRPGGEPSALRPDEDLGWIQPSSNKAARLTPLVLPRAGPAAAGLQGARFDLVVPMVIRREPKVFRFSFAVDVRAI